MENNLQDLMAAANQKLAAQRKEQAKSEQSAESGDIYADMRQESEQDIDYGTAPTIKYHPESTDDVPTIQHDPQAEDPIFVDMELTPLFEGGPPVGQVALWKKQFTKEKVYHTQILERHFIFRTLNRFEYKQIVAIDNIDALYREEIICATCILWPRNYDFKKMAEEDSGYPSTLAQIIMENSGFTKEYGIEVL